MKHIIFFILLMSISFPAFASGQSVVYQVNNQNYKGYYNSPTPSAGLVLLIHDWNGLTDYEIKRADMLADMGYTVFAADLFGSGVRPTKVQDKRQHTGELYKDREKMRNLLQGALKTAKAKGADIQNAVAMGYCFGGAAVLELARSSSDLKGYVTFHGGLSTPEGQSYSRTKGKLLILHGSADRHVTLDDFANLAKELEENGVPHEMITYGGAPHAFTVFAADSYREDVDRKSWRRFQQFLKDTLR